MKKNIDFKSAYFIGIKGVGMTMLAQFLASRGVKISGSDVLETFMTDQVLKKNKIKVSSPFSLANLPNQVDLFVHSSAYTAENNIEVKELKSRGAKLYSYAEALGQIFNLYQGIAVCGSHGKTTTSAWLGYVLQAAKKSPNVLVGARVPQFQGNALIGKSSLMIAEVDEYQNKLQYFQPQGVLLSNIDYDHPDFFKTEAAYQLVFAEFIKKIPRAGFLVANYDDPLVKKMVKDNRGQTISYSLKDKRADYYATDLKIERGRQVFSVFYRGRLFGQVKTVLAGEHNVYNALATMAAALKLGVKKSEVLRAIGKFKGAARRLEVLGKYRGVEIIDDYGHHPTEVQATLSALKNLYPKRRLVVLFHPHTFTRTKALFSAFSSSFFQADSVLLLDIYGSAREKQGGVSAVKLAKAIGSRSRVETKYIGSLIAAEKYLRQNLKPNDLLLLLGAGDVFRVGQSLIYGKRK